MIDVLISWLSTPHEEFQTIGALLAIFLLVGHFLKRHSWEMVGTTQADWNLIVNIERGNAGYLVYQCRCCGLLKLEPYLQSA